jgi:hypothetical protein
MRLASRIVTRGRLDEQLDWDCALAQAGDAKYVFYQAVRQSPRIPRGSLRRFKLARGSPLNQRLGASQSTAR